MVEYEELGFPSFQDYSMGFLDSLMLTNHTYGFFVDWDKVYNKLVMSLFEISLLNGLNKVPSCDVEEKFRELISTYPNVVPILPSILAVRGKKVPVFDQELKQSKEIKFNKTQFDIDEIVDFAINSGLLGLFNNIDDLYSYLLGTEVGLDTNARKNRSGHIFEDIVGNLLEEKIDNFSNYHLVKEDSSVSIIRNKRFDYVLYDEDIPKIAFECNFYSSHGSKPIEVAHAYTELQKELDEQGIKFIWVTDGQGWKKMFSTLSNVAKDIDYILNYAMLNEKFDIFL